jgi:hypothetical protein
MFDAVMIRLAASSQLLSQVGNQITRAANFPIEERVEVRIPDQTLAAKGYEIPLHIQLDRHFQMAFYNFYAFGLK